VTVHEVRLLSDSGKSDYVLAGEGVTFSCLFILDPKEYIISVIWQKDKEQVKNLTSIMMCISASSCVR
jgi:hypothetical protein